MQWIACSHRLDIITTFYIQEVVAGKVEWQSVIKRVLSGRSREEQIYAGQ